MRRSNQEEFLSNLEEALTWLITPLTAYSLVIFGEMIEHNFLSESTLRFIGDYLGNLPYALNALY